MWVHHSAGISWLVKSQITLSLSRGECGNLILPLPQAWCWLLSVRALSAWPIRVTWWHRSHVWKLKVASLLTDELELLHAKICSLSLFPPSSLVFVISIFRDVCSLFFVPQSNYHKGQLQVILKCSSVLSKYRFLFLCPPSLPSTNCGPKGSVGEY